jgi:hypothetical protein
VRRVLVLGALAFGMTAAAGLSIYDSARVARTEQARPGPESVPTDARPIRTPIADQVQRQNRQDMGEFRPEDPQRRNLENGISRMDENARQGPAYEPSTLPVFSPQPTDETMRRRPLRGDFWQPGEFYDLMGRPDDSFSR